MGCFRSSSFISALCLLLGVWIRSVSPSLPCSPDDRITSHPVELVGSDHNPSCSRASGSGWRDHPFSRRVSARGLIRGHRPPGSGEAVAFSFAGMGLVIKPLLECWSGIEPSGHAGACRLEHGALGNDALGDIAPQGDEEFAGQRHDGDAADSSLAGADPRLKPAAQRRSPAGGAARTRQAQSWCAAGDDCPTWRSPDPVRRRRSARGWAPIQHMPLLGVGCRSCETTIQARGATRTQGPCP